MLVINEIHLGLDGIQSVIKKLQKDFVKNKTRMSLRKAFYKKKY